MNNAGQNSELEPDRLAELSALADGTLDPGRRAEVEARISSSDELRTLYLQERRAVAALSTARESDRAPAELRARLEAAGGSRRAGGARPVRPPRRGWILAPAGRAGVLTGLNPAGRAGLVAGLAALIVALVLVLPAGTPGAPSVSQAAALGARGPALPAPAANPTAPAELLAAVDSLHFPNWSRTIGWRAIGQRHDTLRGRRVLTVYYTRAGRTVAYSIVSGSPLVTPRANAAEPYALQSFRKAGRNVVTWRQAGHTCVLSAAGLSEQVLAALVGRA